jgi:hypothetical protein
MNRGGIGQYECRNTYNYVELSQSKGEIEQFGQITSDPAGLIGQITAPARNRSDIPTSFPSLIFFKSLTNMATLLKQPLKLALIQLASGINCSQTCSSVTPTDQNI